MDPFSSLTSTAPSSTENSAAPLPSSTETVASTGSGSSLLRADLSIEEIRWNFLLTQSATRALFQEERDSSSSSSSKISSKSGNGENTNIGGSLSFHEVPIVRKRPRSITASDFIFSEDEEQIAHSDSRLSDLVLFLNDKTTAQISRITDLENKNDELLSENETLTNDLVRAESEIESMKREILKMAALLEAKDDEIEQRKSHVTFLEVLRTCQALEEDGKTDETHASSSEIYQEVHSGNADVEDVKGSAFRQVIPSTPWVQSMPKQSEKRTDPNSLGRIDAVPSTMAKETVLAQRR